MNTGSRLGRLLWIARLAAFVAAGGVFAVSVWFAWTALMVPLDLEIREGSVWILVLAKRAGVDIYDSSRVAFANMNHGPMDAVLKGWIGTHIPSLAGHVVVRFFVLLFPFLLLGSAYYVCRRSWTTALLAAGALHLLFVHITLTVMLGRSDATLLCAAAIGFALTHALLVTRHRNWTNRRYVALQVAFGACGAVMFLINWRIFPTIGVMVLLTLAKQVAESSYRLWRTAFAAIGLYVGGFVLVWLPTLLFELHGDFQLFYRRSLGFFTQASGWGAHPGTKFQLFPAEIHESRVALLLLFAALALAALYQLRRERAQLIVWLLVLPLGWVVHSYAFYANRIGGGPHYYYPYLLMAWFLVLHALRRPGRWRPLAQVAVAGLFIWFYPWQPLFAQGRHFRELTAQSQSFLDQVNARTEGQSIVSENAHLYKVRYSGEVADCGDVVDVIKRSGYFGKEFARTYDRYMDDLEAHPPKFIVSAWFNPREMAATSSARFTRFLRERYRLAIQGPSHLVANGRGGTSLYERKDD